MSRCAEGRNKKMYSGRPIKTFCGVRWVAVMAGMLILSALACRQRPAEEEKREERKNEAPPTARDVQPPLVAGTFYPGTEAELRAMVEGFLAQAQPPPLSGKLFGLIAPHAGYIYSGPVAAYAYKLLPGRGERRFVILGPSHRVRLAGAFVLVKDAYRTPLGEVRVDRERALRLAGARPWLVSNPAYYQAEHSLEVQIPFLQVAAGPDIVISLIMLGELSREQIADLAGLLTEVFPKDTVFIASTDMSHGNYPPFQGSDQIRPVDLRTLELIRTLDLPGLEEGVFTGSAPLCGGLPVLTLVHLFKLRGGSQMEILKYGDSGDATGDHSRVVGYGAVAFLLPTEERKAEEAAMEKEKKETASPGSGFTLTEAEKIELLKMARACVEAAVRRQEPPEQETKFDNLKRPAAAFVTLKNTGRLRGCIGTIFADEPLYKCVQRRAVDAAIRDSRFLHEPITPGELSRIEIEISVLTPPVPARPEEIVVGRDGLLLSVGMYHGVFLPQVPVEQGWDREEYLSNLCFKAGSSNPNCWRHPDARLERFEALVFSEHELGLK